MSVLRAEAVLRAYGLPDAAVRAYALRWFDTGDPAHLLTALRHCEQVGRPPPWWLRQLLAAALAPSVTPENVRDWQRWWWVRYGRSRREASWTERGVYEYAAAKIGEHISKPAVHKSYGRVAQAYRCDNHWRYPDILIIEDGWRPRPPRVGRKPR